jgi:hypothetical protein
MRVFKLSPYGNEKGHADFCMLWLKWKKSLGGRWLPCISVFAFMCASVGWRAEPFLQINSE